MLVTVMGLSESADSGTSAEGALAPDRLAIEDISGSSSLSQQYSSKAVLMRCPIGGASQGWVTDRRKSHGQAIDDSRMDTK